MSPKPPKRKDSSEELRKLPQVERLGASLQGDASAAEKVDAARLAIEAARETILSGEAAPDLDDLVSDAEGRLQQSGRKRMSRLINATGVLLHTNLGRAPLPEHASKNIDELATGYTNLEFDLVSAKRGSRYDHSVEVLKRLTGAEDALVVNNNAGAVFLALSALAGGGDVIISRGELIEIGGEFRIPEILSASGARLVEVGTTNRTHLKDYRRAIGDRTLAIMKVHPSNYRVVGFSASASAADLADLAKRQGLLFIHDLGSGLLRRKIAGTDVAWLADEPTVVEAVSAGADVVTFSGDKLMGGPQAGIICGTAAALARIRKAPLLRTMRVGKLALAALDSVLDSYMRNDEGGLPFWKMALSDVGEIEDRARAVLDRLEDVSAKVDVVDGFSTTGGGSGPGSKIPTSLIEISPLEGSVTELHRSLVAWSTPIIGRVADDRLLLDLRGVFPSEDDKIVSALNQLL